MSKSDITSEKKGKDKAFGSAGDYSKSQEKKLDMSHLGGE